MINFNVVFLIYRYFKQVQKNVHVFLLLPLSLDISQMEADTTSVTRAHLTRAVGLCCYVEVYQPWSSQTLVEAASRHLKENLQIPDPASKGLWCSTCEVPTI